jgi:integrase
MSNDFKFYDPERKNKFLYEQYPNESTRNTYGSLLQKISDYEEDNRKDLCDFSLSEATELLIGLRKISKESLNTAHSIINMYVEWCISPDQNYSKTGFNAFRLLESKDKNRFVHKIAQKLSYITRDEMYEICNQLYNYIDKAIICLLFEGVKGRPSHSFEELRNLKQADIYPENNQIVLTRFDENNIATTRLIDVDQRTMIILVGARNESTYHKENGESKSTFAIMELKGNQYLIQTADNGGDGEDDRITISSLQSRFKNFRKYTGIKFLTPNTLFQSGLFERCQEKENEYGGKLMIKHYEEIFQDLKLNEKQAATLKGKYESYKKNKASK